FYYKDDKADFVSIEGSNKAYAGVKNIFFPSLAYFEATNEKELITGAVFITFDDAETAKRTYKIVVPEGIYSGGPNAGYYYPKKELIFEFDPAGFSETVKEIEKEKLDFTAERVVFATGEERVLELIKENMSVNNEKNKVYDLFNNVSTEIDSGKLIIKNVMKKDVITINVVLNDLIEQKGFTETAFMTNAKSLTLTGKIIEEKSLIDKTKTLLSSFIALEEGEKSIVYSAKITLNEIDFSEVK
ncbi:MAG: hypothetical protein JW703_05155, partial [Candidatus Diapherotrites archaeon]|nr:hypothetical protein [Candidatus Diapherotrites archaeon]